MVAAAVVGGSVVGATVVLVVVDELVVVVLGSVDVVVVEVDVVAPGIGSGASPVATTLVLESGIGVCDSTSGVVSVGNVLAVPAGVVPLVRGSVVAGAPRRAVVGGAGVSPGDAGTVATGCVTSGASVGDGPSAV